MKAIISTTYDDKYLYFLPIVTWCWNKLGVDVICFLPKMRNNNQPYFDEKMKLITKYLPERFGVRLEFFDCPEHKEATYSQCSRLYGACLDFPEDEVLITSDVDMAVFKLPPYHGGFTIFGGDLVPDGQYPMCYASATAKEWRQAFKLNNKTYQQCLDETIGKEECENMRGNLWSRDQETLKNMIMADASFITNVKRARPGTQFSDNRIDRDDINWRSYMNENLIDAHLWRPGYTEENFPKIMELMTTMYPQDDFNWLIEYNEKYKQLL